jgi:phosphoribosylamine--glycine ligase
MGPHLASHDAAGEYARELLARAAPGDSVLIEEKILGAEFTIQAVSDGTTTVFPAPTYDYPFRYDGDEGPGTGGMGSLSLADATLPFLSEAQYRQACSIIQRVIERLGQLGRRFTGIMNSGFFATAGGVKVIEFNARFGDPECMNIMSLFEGDWPYVMGHLASGTLSPADVELRKEASLVLYLVSPDYALRAGEPYEFELDRAALEAPDAGGRAGCHVFFASAVQSGENTYRTVGTSRAVALATTAPTLEQARLRLVERAGLVRGPLQWRRDVGSGRYLEDLAKLVGSSAVVI